MMRLVLALALLVAALPNMARAAGVDYSYVWGERMHTACQKYVRESMKKNLRGLCDLLQDLIELFISKVRSEFEGLAVDAQLMPRLEKKYYKDEGLKGIQSTIEYAVDGNIKERALLGDHIDKWGQVWIRMASKGQTNDGGIEYSTDPKNIAKRVAEYEQAKRQRDLEREAGL